MCCGTRLTALRYNAELAVTKSSDHVSQGYQLAGQISHHVMRDALTALRYNAELAVTKRRAISMWRNQCLLAAFDAFRYAEKMRWLGHQQTYGRSVMYCDIRMELCCRCD
jgi:hypothetical protein